MLDLLNSMLLYPSPYIRIAPIGISNLFEFYKNKEQFFLLKNKTELFYKLSSKPKYRSDI
jgi:hypothetical protein